MNRRIKTFLFLLLLVVATAGVAVDPNLPENRKLIADVNAFCFKNPTWINFRTANFIILTDWSPADAREFGAVAEETVRESALLFPYSERHRNSTDPLRKTYTIIKIFKDAQTAIKHHGAAVNKIGGRAYMWGGWVLVKASHKDMKVFHKKNITKETLRHEISHIWSAHMFPTWMDEGLAECATGKPPTDPNCNFRISLRSFHDPVAYIQEAKIRPLDFDYSKSLAILYFLMVGAPANGYWDYALVPHRYWRDGYKCDPWRGIDMRLFEQRFNAFWASETQQAKADRMTALRVVQELRKRYPNQVVAADGSCPGGTEEEQPKDEEKATAPALYALNLKASPSDLRRQKKELEELCRTADARIKQTLALKNPDYRQMWRSEREKLGNDIVQYKEMLKQLSIAMMLADIEANVPKTPELSADWKALTTAELEKLLDEKMENHAKLKTYTDKLPRGEKETKLQIQRLNKIAEQCWAIRDELRDRKKDL